MRDEFAAESTTLQRRSSVSSESEFIALADRVLEAIAAGLDAADADVDWTLNDGVLTIEDTSGGKLIVNRHVPSRELWVAAKSGGFHFRGDAGVWRDTKDGTELGVALVRLLRAQAGVAIELSPLPVN